MPRLRKPSNILELSGAWKQNPQRRRRSVPKSKREIKREPPDYFDAGQREAWQFLLERVPDQVLKDADEAIFEMASVMFARFREQGADSPAYLLTRLDIMLDRMGMTPSGREKLTVPQQDENEFKDF